MTASPAPSSAVAVVGPGGVGGYFAGHLAAAGREVIACARRPFDRYLIDSDTHPLDHPATVLTDPAQVEGTVEWVLLAVKGHQTEGAAGWLGALCDENTQVLVVQNGIEHDRAAPFVNGATIIPTVVYCGAELVAPGHVRHGGNGFLYVPTGAHEAELLALFEGSAAEVRPRDDFAEQQWRKLSINVVANGLTALTGRPVSVIGEPTLTPVATAMMQECWAVGRADGADLDPDEAERLVGAMVAASGDTVTSMLQDTRAGRPTEHDAIQGALLRRAARHGVEVPTVAVVHALLAARSPDE